MGAMISLTGKDGFTLSAYRADPKDAPKAGIVLLQEIYGVNHHIKAMADKFADLGYLVVAPSLFYRLERGVELDYTQEDRDQGMTLAKAVKPEDALNDIEAAVAAAAEAGKVGVVGYCWGGALAYIAAATIAGLGAAVGYYGGGIAENADKKPKAPTLLHFGSKDPWISQSDVAKIRAAQPDVSIFTYDAGHGFNCDERDSYDQKSAQEAQERTNEFLEKNLIVG